MRKGCYRVSGKYIFGKKHRPHHMRNTDPIIASLPLAMMGGELLCSLYNMPEERETPTPIANHRLNTALN